MSFPAAECLFTGPMKKVAMVTEWRLCMGFNNIPDLVITTAENNTEPTVWYHSGGEGKGTRQPPAGRLITLDPFHHGGNRNLSLMEQSLFCI